jgi:hypothetical protein
LHAKDIIQKFSARPLAGGILYFGKNHDDVQNWPIVHVEVDALLSLIANDPERSFLDRFKAWDKLFHDTTATVVKTKDTPAPIPSISLFTHGAYCFTYGEGFEAEPHQRPASETDLMWPHRDNVFAALNDLDEDSVHLIYLMHALGVKRTAVQVPAHQEDLLVAYLNEESLEWFSWESANESFFTEKDKNVVDFEDR